MKRFLLFTFSMYEMPYDHAWDHFILDFDDHIEALLHLINNKTFYDGAQIVDTHSLDIVGSYVKDYQTGLWEFSKSTKYEHGNRVQYTTQKIFTHEKNHYWCKKLRPISNAITSIGDGGVIW